MSSSREDSPDWLHAFQVPASSTLILSSDSERSYDGSPLKEDSTDFEELSLRKSSEGEEDEEHLGRVLGGDGYTKSKSKLKSPEKGKKLKKDDVSPGNNKSDKLKKKKGDSDSDKKAAKKVKGLKQEVLSLSSDSEASLGNSPVRSRTARGRSSEQIAEAKDEKNPSEPEDDAHLLTKGKKKRDVKREGDTSDVEVAEEEVPEKQVESRVSSVRLPLMLSDKVQRTKALVECEGDSIDLAGDMGSVGRVIISDTMSGDNEMYLDMKGTIYKTTIVPSRTFCVVSFGQSEAKIEAIMNDFIQLKPQSNVFEAETMVEGTLDGFSFDSDEEADKVPKGVGQETNEDGEGKVNGKSKGKPEKKSSVGRKRGKAAVGKSQPQKKKKAQPSKKAKTKK